MTIERAKQLAKKWANGYVCSLREGEAEEYHKLCFSALQEQREQDYGTPEDSFQKIGTFWTAYLNYAVKIDAEDVAAMMALLKIARISENPQHMDSWVDGCGYFSCGGEIAGK